jgi:CDP-6-deoxy-D-xylo-4-hexulose-3-dehydrase
MQQNNFNWPLINDNISQQDKKKLSEFVLQTNRFTNGPKVKQFEKTWSIWLGVNYSVMVNSGSSANYITAAITREIKGQSGEIIVPPIGWVSDIASVINTGFTPVFVDVDLKTMSISYENIKNAINENTKAIVLVHGLGFNGINDKIIELAKKHNLLLIEDCCEAHGAKHGSHRVGTFGDMSCFSFYFGHHMTTIEGGMICTNNKYIYELAKMYRSHGMTREASEETQKKYSKPDLNPLFTFAVPGYNMRSSEINAVLGLEQIKRLDDNIKIRAENLGVWLNALNSDLYYTDFNYKNNSNFALPLIAKNKSIIEKACLVLEEQKVEYRIGTAGGGNQARQPYLANYNYKVSGELNNSNYIHDCGLYVGNHTEIDKNKIEKLCMELNNV